MVDSVDFESRRFHFFDIFRAELLSASEPREFPECAAASAAAIAQVYSRRLNSAADSSAAKTSVSAQASR